MAWIGTTELLDANETWTSSAVKTKLAGSVRGIVFSDESGSLTIEFSSDGTNWDYETTAISITGGTGKSFNESVVAPYYRLVYTNGATGQGEFRITANTYSYA